MADDAPSAAEYERRIAAGLGALLAQQPALIEAQREGISRPESRSGPLLLPGMLVEFVASAITLAVRCTGTREPLIAHLTVAALVFTAIAGSALLRERVDQ
jgi:hypothetical protein